MIQKMFRIINYFANLSGFFNVWMVCRAKMTPKYSRRIDKFKSGRIGILSYADHKTSLQRSVTPFALSYFFKNIPEFCFSSRFY
jgi:hypothetical protein